MYRLLYIVVFLFLCSVTFSQNSFKKVFPKSAVTLQFAGSTGLFTTGFSKITARDKIELGILYGYLPRAFGGPHSSLSGKFSYNPFQFNLNRNVMIEPVQTGVFVSRNFNDNLGANWSSKYPKDYYWWTRSVRFHYFISTQISYKFKKVHLDRLAFYFEANTNDLYLASYLPNRKTLGLYDIFFFGTGIKLYLK